MAILGFSSSPIKGGNVERMVQALLEKSGKTTEFVNLPELSYGPCRACAHLCAGDNLCDLEDDLKPLYSRIAATEALVLGTPSWHHNMNIFMAAFLERLWAFRHMRFPLEGKPFALVSSGGLSAPDKAIEAVKLRMIAYRAKFIGGVGFVSKILPCFKCGYGLTCKVGRLYQVYGEEGQKNLRITKDLFQKWEDSPETVAKIKELGEKLAAL